MSGKTILIVATTSFGVAVSPAGVVGQSPYTTEHVQAIPPELVEEPDEEVTGQSRRRGRGKNKRRGEPTQSPNSRYRVHRGDR